VHATTQRTVCALWCAAAARILAMHAAAHGLSTNLSRGSRLCRGCCRCCRLLCTHRHCTGQAGCVSYALKRCFKRPTAAPSGSPGQHISAVQARFVAHQTRLAACSYPQPWCRIRTYLRSFVHRQDDGVDLLVAAHHPDHEGCQVLWEDELSEGSARASMSLVLLPARVAQSHAGKEGNTGVCKQLSSSFHWLFSTAPYEVWVGHACLLNVCLLPRTLTPMLCIPPFLRWKGHFCPFWSQLQADITHLLDLLFTHTII